MANALFDSGREGFLDGSIDWDTDNIILDLIDEADDVIDLALDVDRADRATAARVATTGNLGSKTVTAGTADAADPTFSSVSGDVSESLDIAQNTGTLANDRLIGNIDTATGLPVTPNGGDITVTFDNGSNRIFTL